MGAGTVGSQPAGCEQHPGMSVDGEMPLLREGHMLGMQEAVRLLLQPEMP